MAPENDFQHDANGHADDGSAEQTLSGRNGALIELPEPPNGRLDKVRPAALSAPPSPIELARALQRRWLLALILAICCSIPPALAAWYFVPVTYSTKTWLRADNSPGLFSTRTTGETSLQTHQVLIRSPFVLNAALRAPGINSLPTIQKVDAENLELADWLASQLQVKVGGNNEYMIISMSGEHPQDITEIVNAVTDAYLDRVVNEERVATLRKRDQLEQTFANKNEVIRKQIEAINSVARTLGTSDSNTAEQKQLLLMDYVGSIRSEVKSLERQLRNRQRDLGMFKRKHEIGEDGLPAITEELLAAYAAQDPQVQQLRLQIEESETKFREYAGLRRNFETSDRGRSMIQQIRDLRDQADARQQALRAQLVKERDEGTLVTPLQAQYQELQLQTEHLDDELQITKKAFLENSEKIEEISSYSTDMSSQQAELTRLRSIVGQIGMELEKLGILLAERERIEQLSPAEVPRTPDTGKRDKLTALAGLGGIALALLGVAFFEFQSRRITNFTTIEDGLGVRVMGDVPMLTGKRWSLFGGVNGEGALQGMMDESIDGIRSMLLHVGNEDSVRCVLLTSARASEGKTTVASSLAASIGRSGRRTLLVDGDLRRPSVHRLLDIPNRSGFCEVLNGEAAISDVVRPSRSPGLWVMTAGQCSPEALQALAREGVAEIFEQFRAEFDFIVVDSGPVLAVVDPLLLGPYTDGAIVSVIRSVSQMSSVYETCDRLDGVGVRVLGSVVNGTNTGRFGFDYYGYGYGYGYGSVNGDSSMNGHNGSHEGYEATAGTSSNNV